MSRSFFMCGVCALILGQQAPSTNAALILNGSFESPGLLLHQAVIAPINAIWTFTRPSGIINPPGEPIPGQGDYAGYPAPDGAQYGFIQAGLGQRGTISQQIVLPDSGQYRLTFMEAGRPHQNFTLPTGGDQSYAITIGATNIATLASTSGEQFTSRTVDFTATAGTYALTFAALGALNQDNTTFIDNVVLTAIPEPGMFAAIGLGCMALIRPRRKTASA